MEDAVQSTRTVIVDPDNLVAFPQLTNCKRKWSPQDIVAILK